MKKWFSQNLPGYCHIIPTWLLKYPAQQDSALSWNSAEFDTKDQQGQASKNPLRKGRQDQSYISQALWKYAYALAYKLNDLICFEPKKVHFEVQCYRQWLFKAPLCITLKFEIWVVAYFLNFFKKKKYIYIKAILCNFSMRLLKYF